MHSVLRVRAHIVLALAWTCILLLNDIFLKSVSIGVLACFFYVLSVSVAVRRRLFPNIGTFVGLCLGAYGAFALFIIMSVAVYWIAGWYIWGIFIVLFFLPLAVCMFPARERTLSPDDGSIGMILSTSTRTMHGVIIFFLQAILLTMLYRTRVIHAVVSPWEAIPSFFMPLFALTTFLLIAYYLRRDASAGVFLAGAHAVLMAAAALMVFPLGYGFDPFIHRSAVSHIFENGILLPKTPYYIGQYTPLVAAGHLIGPRTMDLLDRFLIPFLAPIMIVVSLKVGMQQAGARRFVPLAALSPFIIPFSSFIVTTPQSLGYLFFAVMLFLSLGLVKHDGIPLLYIWFMALASIAVHPLSGVPALVGAVLITLLTCRASILRSIIIFLVLAGSSFILPLLLLFGGKSINQISDVVSHLGLPRFSWQIDFARPLDPTLDILYAARFALLPVLIVVFGYGLWLVARSRDSRRMSIVYIGLAVVLVVNAALMASGMPMPLVIDYEQQNYSLRVMEMLVFALMPLLCVLVYHFFDRLMHAPRLIRLTGIAVFVVALSASMYFSYPQNNPVERNHGYTVAQADFDTVDAIADHANKNDYVVLANQQVSAAAIERLGFVRYFATSDGEQFLYPIPTGGRLYAFYLQMMYEEPSRAVARHVMDYMGVDRVYLVVNPYWWDADTIATAALREADASFQIDFANRVFVFER